MVQLDLFGFPVEEKPVKKQEQPVAVKQPVPETPVNKAVEPKAAEPIMNEVEVLPVNSTDEIMDEDVEQKELNTPAGNTIETNEEGSVEQVSEADDITANVEHDTQVEVVEVVANNDNKDDGAKDDEEKHDDEEDDAVKDDDVIVFSRPLFSKPALEAIEAPGKKDAIKTKGRRGRKSFKEIDLEIALVEVPDDEILQQKLYYPISQVAKWFNVNTSLLRFWENEFDILKPRKNRKGDRMFRPEDVKNLQIIYYLLRQRKFSIEGAKKYIKQNKNKAEVNIQLIQSLTKFRSFLLEMKANLGA